MLPNAASLSFLSDVEVNMGSNTELSLIRFMWKIGRSDTAVATLISIAILSLAFSESVGISEFHTS